MTLASHAPHLAIAAGALLFLAPLLWLILRSGRQ
jgi:hypothetical protein